jgi:hypothetical protein
VYSKDRLTDVLFKVGAIGITFYGISIMLTKLSILTLFLRFVPRGNLRVTIYITIAIVVLYSLVTSFEWVYACRPMEKYWDLTITGGSCVDGSKIPVFSGVMNTVTDVAILILPILILRSSRLPKKQKIGVIIVLMTGGLYVYKHLDCIEAKRANTWISVLVVSIVRVKLTADMTSTKDVSWDSFSFAMWW